MLFLSELFQFQMMDVCHCRTVNIVHYPCVPLWSWVKFTMWTSLEKVVTWLSGQKNVLEHAHLQSRMFRVILTQVLQVIVNTSQWIRSLHYSKHTTMDSFSALQQTHHSGFIFCTTSDTPQWIPSLHYSKSPQWICFLHHSKSPQWIHSLHYRLLSTAV